MAKIIMQDEVGLAVSPPAGKSFLYLEAGQLKSKDSSATVRVYGEGITTEQVQDIVGALFIDSTALHMTYDDAANTMTADVKDGSLVDAKIVSIGAAKVTQDSTHRFVSDANISTWNSKENAVAAGTIAQYYRGDKTFQTLDRAAVGLGNVDNTSDSAKPVSTATQTALNLKENAIAAGTTTQYLRGDKSWQTLDKSAVGLSVVDNTQDLLKPISNSTQAALNLKVNSSLVGVANGICPLDSTQKIAATYLPSFVDDVLEFATFSAFPATGESGKIYVALDTNFTYRWSVTVYVNMSSALALGETSATAYRGDRGAIAYNHSQVVSGNPHGTVKADIGLSLVDNTADLSKPVSTATQTALNAKENILVAGLSTQYYKGDKTWAVLDKASVGLGNVDNTADLSKPISTATQTALSAKENTVAAGTTAQYYRGDKTWQTHDKASVGLNLVDNTADLSKPISTATQTALNAKENTVATGTTAQYYRGDKTWATHDKASVGLGSVDNTADLSKPISTATQTALNAKENTVAAGTITQYYRGDKSWQTLDKASVGLGSVDNTADLNKPISNLTQTALNTKENSIAIGTTTQYFRGDKTWQTHDKASVGLSLVPNIDATARASHTGTQLSTTISDFTEAAQDAVGTALVSSATITFNYPDVANQITATVNEVGLTRVTQVVDGLMHSEDKVKLDGIISDVIQVVGADLTNASNVTLTQIPALSINVVAGQRYTFNARLLFSSAAAGTGIGFSMGGTAVGTLAAQTKAPISNSGGTDAFYEGVLTALNAVMVSTAVGTANVPYFGTIEGIFLCTTSGTLVPQFRSESNGTAVTIKIGSNLTYKQF